MSSFKSDFPGAEVIASSNHGERRDACLPDMIVLHYTGMPTAEGALDWLCRPESEVSSHYMVFEDGRIVQLVPESRRAWHAGRSLWKGEADINSLSIGIEIANPGHPGGLPPFPEAQIEAVARLCRDCGERWQIAPDRVLAHSDVAPIRKVDPGENFPWNRLHEQGVGHWVVPAPISGGRYFQRGDGGQPVEALQSMLAFYGYGIEITGEFCERTEGVVAAFQRHFRPLRVDGVADASTIDTLHRLLTSLPRLSA
jgi:N-acetylmuramoyl-L-alanine amidase